MRAAEERGSREEPGGSSQGAEEGSQRAVVVRDPLRRGSEWGTRGNRVVRHLPTCCGRNEGGGDERRASLTCRGRDEGGGVFGRTKSLSKQGSLSLQGDELFILTTFKVQRINKLPP